jgi:hypothetical protein
MSTVKGLKLLRYLSFGVDKKFHPGEYVGDIPPELLAELDAGSRHIVEMQNIPTIAQTPAPKQELSKQETVETTKVPPKKATPPKPKAKTTRAAKTPVKK